MLHSVYVAQREKYELFGPWRLGAPLPHFLMAVPHTGLRRRGRRKRSPFTWSPTDRTGEMGLCHSASVLSNCKAPSSRDHGMFWYHRSAPAPRGSTGGQALLRLLTLRPWLCPDSWASPTHGSRAVDLGSPAEPLERPVARSGRLVPGTGRARLQARLLHLTVGTGRQLGLLCLFLLFLLFGPK